MGEHVLVTNVSVSRVSSSTLQNAASFTYFRAKPLLQTGHLNGFSSVWVAICRARCS